MMPAVSLHDVAVARRGHTVWSDGSFEIPRGGVVIVIGPNGSGKTTLLEMLLGLVPPTTGSLEVLGQAPRRGSRRIGYVPQNYTATIGHAVRSRDLVGLGRSGNRWGPSRLDAADRHAIDAALASVAADGFADQRMSQLSGGQQRRVAVAQTLVDDPELVLLDEPLANLDMRNQQEIVDLLAQLHAQREVTFMVLLALVITMAVQVVGRCCCSGSS